MAKYDNLSTSELSRITRERGLDKPQVLNAGEWAAWLRKQDQVPPTATDYASYTVSELHTIADQRGIDHSAAQRKADLIALLKSDDGG